MRSGCHGTTLSIYRQILKGGIFGEFLFKNWFCLKNGSQDEGHFAFVWRHVPVEGLGFEIRRQATVQRGAVLHRWFTLFLVILIPKQVSN